MGSLNGRTKSALAALSAVFFSVAFSLAPATPAVANNESNTPSTAGNVAKTATTPTDTVRNTVDEVLRVLNDPRYKTPEMHKERLRILEDLIGDLADFNEVSSRVLGKHWKEIDDKQKKEFIELFKKFLSRSHAEKMEKMAGEKVDYKSERLSGDYAEVITMVSPGRGNIPMDYRLIKKGEKWRAYDVIVDNISQVQNYRSQFNKIIRDSSFDELLQTLREKNTQMDIAPQHRGSPPSPPKM